AHGVRDELDPADTQARQARRTLVRADRLEVEAERRPARDEPRAPVERRDEEDGRRHAEEARAGERAEVGPAEREEAAAREELPDSAARGEEHQRRDDRRDPHERDQRAVPETQRETGGEHDRDDRARGKSGPSQQSRGERRRDRHPGADREVYAARREDERLS